jgi:hypothetical protein
MNIDDGDDPKFREYGSNWKCGVRVEYIHLNPVRARSVGQAQDWRPSTFNECAGTRPKEQLRRRALTVDRVRMPADPRTRL